MIREPSAFSYVRNLDVGDSVSVPAEKGYAIRCAVAYLEAEYGYLHRIEQTDEGTIKVTRTQ